MFLREMGHVPQKEEMVAIIRRIDLDGDMTISYREFRRFMKIIDVNNVNENPSPAKSRD